MQDHTPHSPRCGAYSAQYVLNPLVNRAAHFPGIFAQREIAAVREFFRTYPGYAATPLRSLPCYASELGIGEVLVKDESMRLGLNSFKIVGVSYAVQRLFENGALRRDSIVACATDGNHGRAVARVARQNQLQARIFVPRGTIAERVQAIAGEGATVVVVPGNYDYTVRFVADRAKENGWVLISDTAWPGYEAIPRDIMTGYGQILSEAAEQWASPPDLVFVQAGVGGIACAVVSWFLELSGAKRPRLVCCEPQNAACVLQSVLAGNPVVLPGSLETIMDGLSAGTVSSIAWPILQYGLDACVAIPDTECSAVIRRLADPCGNDPAIEAGESGVCGLASLIAILRGEHFRPLREHLELGSKSRVLVINTEGRIRASNSRQQASLEDETVSSDRLRSMTEQEENRNTHENQA